MATCAAFFKQSRMHFDNAAILSRKSGGAQWRDLQFSYPNQEFPIWHRECALLNNHGQP
jgi:hypothetical protein